MTRLLHRLRLLALRYLAWRLLRAADRREREARRIRVDPERLAQALYRAERGEQRWD